MIDKIYLMIHFTILQKLYMHYVLAINTDIYNIKVSFVLKAASFFHIDNEILI